MGGIGGNDENLLVPVPLAQTESGGGGCGRLSDAAFAAEKQPTRAVVIEFEKTDGALLLAFPIICY